MPTVKRTARPNQRRGLRWLQTRSVGALFWEMRLGKTLTAIRWAESLNVKSVLVIAPLSVIDTWVDECAIEGVNATVLHGTSKTRALCESSSKWFITNFESVSDFVRGNAKRPIPSDIALYPWGCVIVDESTRIRNPKAQTTRNIRNAFSNVPYKLLLSGLPAPEGAEDYFEQASFLLGSFMGYSNFWKWRAHYFEPDFKGWEWREKSGVREMIKEAVDDFAFVLTRKDAGVGNVKIYEKRYIDLPKYIKTIYDKGEKEFDFGNVDTKYITVKISYLHQIAGGYPKFNKEIKSDHKTIELINLLTGELQKEQVLVWFRHNDEIRSVKEQLDKHKIKSEIINGNTPRVRRTRYRKQFNKGKIRVLLLQIKTGLYGLDLSASSTAIYYSRDYSLEANKQSEDRIESLSKNEPLLIIDLVTRGTIDEDIIGALFDKSIKARFFMRNITKRFNERCNKNEKA